LRVAKTVFALLAVLVPIESASADLVVSQLVIELRPKERTADVEIFNDSTERSFVSIEPREIIAPGTAAEKPYTTPDPERLGLLVSPRRVVLEPRQRRTLRVAAIGPVPEKERVYRVTVKPVVGDVAGSESGLKLLVGYDLLVLARPAAGDTSIEVSRNGRNLMLTNRGKSSVELIDGKVCDLTDKTCEPLPNKRLYAGASWQQPLKQSGHGGYRVRSADGWTDLDF
jgi:P pilus assembly chaperone PapD